MRPRLKSERPMESADSGRSEERSYDLEERTARYGEAIIAFCRSLKKGLVIDPLIRQLVRSATSIGVNYCEADDAVSKKEFRLKIATCKEGSSRNQILAANDRGGGRYEEGRIAKAMDGGERTAPDLCRHPSQMKPFRRLPVRHSCFFIPSSFVIRASSLSLGTAENRRKPQPCR